MTVKLSVEVPALPSTIDTSLIAKVGKSLSVIFATTFATAKPL